MQNNEKQWLKGISNQGVYDKWRAESGWAGAFMCLSAALSAVFLFFPPSKNGTIFVSAICLAITLGILLSLHANTSTRPAAEHDRFAGFVDNAFETKTSEFSYYTNGGADKGIKRMAANCFEACFFSDRILKKMTKALAVKKISLAALFATFGYINYPNDIILAAFHVLAGSALIESFINHMRFRSAIKVLLNRFNYIYNTIPTEGDTFAALAVYTLVEYEKAMSNYSQLPSAKIYNKLSPALLVEWEELKDKYGISKGAQAGDDLLESKQQEEAQVEIGTRQAPQGNGEALDEVEVPMESSANSLPFAKSQMGEIVLLPSPKQQPGDGGDLEEAVSAGSQDNEQTYGDGGPGGAHGKPDGPGYAGSVVPDKAGNQEASENANLKGIEEPAQEDAESGIEEETKEEPITGQLKIQSKARE